MSNITAAEILTACDRAAEEYVFPMLDNGYQYPVDVRLHAYGDADRWLLLFETVGYDTRAMNLTNVVTHIGRLEGAQPLAKAVMMLDRLDNHDEILDDDGEHIRAEAPQAVVAGHALPAAMTPGLLIWDFCRTLVPVHRAALLLSLSEIAPLHAAGLAELLTLDQWNHPDLSQGELPSDTEAFQQLASVMAQADPTLYHPSEEPNTHWSNWPEGGLL